MPKLKDILQEVTISSKEGADYTTIQSALSDGIKTLRIEDTLVLSASIVFPSGITLIIGTSASILGSYTLTGNKTVLALEGNNQVFGTTVQFAGSWVSEKVRPEWFGALGDGITDDSTPFAKAISFCKLSSGRVLLLQSTTYIINTGSTIENIAIHGNNAKIIANEGGPFSARGTHGTYYYLSANCYKGDSFIKVSNSTFLSSLSKGDIVKILSDEIAQPVASENVRFGEMHEVRSIDQVNGVIRFNDYVNWNYTLSYNARIARVSIVECLVRDISIWVSSETITSAALNFGYARPHVDNVKLKAYTYGCMFDNCWRPYFRGQTFQTDQDGYGYGVCISSATMYADISGILIGARHCFTTGGSGATNGPTYGGISWHTNVHDSIGTAGKLANTCFDTHASSGSITFHNCLAIGGVYHDYALSITDWNSIDTYPIDSLVRSMTLKLYKALVENTNYNPDSSPSQWVPNAGNNQSGFKAEGLYEKFINCKTIGCNNGLQVYGVDVQEIMVENFDCNEVEYGLLQKYACNVKKLYVDGLRINNDHILGKALYLVGNTTEWHFVNIYTKNAMIVQKSLNTITPTTLTISNARAEYSIPGAYPAVGLYDQNVKVVNLRNVDVKNCHLFASINDNGRVPMRLLEIQGCSVSGNTLDAIYLDHPVENLVINGLQVYDPVDSSKYLIYIRRGLNRLSMTNVSYFGTNALRAIYTYSTAQLGYLLHNNNMMPNLTTFRTGTGALAAIEILGGGIGAMVVMRGSGTPEGVVTASVGTMYLRSNGGASTTLYIKESGTGNTGWIPK